MPWTSVALLLLAAAPVLQEPQAPAASSDDGDAKIYSVARDTTIRLRAAAWFTEADGSFSAGEEIPGTTHEIDLKDTLGLDTDQAVIWATLGFNFGKDKRWHVEAGYTGHFDYDGTSGPINISFNDRVYSGAVNSTAEMDIYELNLRYDLIQSGPFVLSVGPGTRIFDFEATIEGTATDPGTGTTAFRRESQSALIPLPGLGLGVRFDVTENLYVRGSISGIYAGSYGNFFDAAAEAGWDIFSNVGIFGGYRLMHAEADVSDVQFDVDLSGPFAGVEIRF
jgi:opacity protein-like surface antigen